MFASIFALVLTYAPLYLVDLAGLILAVLWRRRHPQVSLLAGIYFLGSLLLSLIANGLAFLPLYLNSHDFSLSQAGTIMGMIGLVRTALQTILGVVLLFAVFGWRNQNIQTTLQEGSPHA